MMIQNCVAPNTTFKNTPEKQSTVRSMSGKDKQLDCGRSRRYCSDAEANDMIHLGSDHRSVTAHFRFPCVKKKRRIWSEDPEPTEKCRKSGENMTNLKRRSLASMKQQHTKRVQYGNAKRRNDR